MVESIVGNATMWPISYGNVRGGKTWNSRVKGEIACYNIHSHLCDILNDIITNKALIYDYTIGDEKKE